MKDNATAPVFSDDDRKAMEAAANHAVAYRADEDGRPVLPKLRPADMAAGYAGPLSAKGTDAVTVIETLVAQATPGVHGHTSPRFFGYVCGGSMPVGAAADFLVTSWGQNSASSWESPAIALMEEAVCRWCLDLLGLPSSSGVGIVSGATVANTQAIMAARDALLARQGWDIDQEGLFGAPPIPVIYGADAHSAPLAGLRYAGLGLGRAIRLETDDQGRILASAMEMALDACTHPPLVILQAGQINTGAFDPFETLVPMIHAKGGWVHVDGAFGLWANAVPALRDRTAGVEAADSWAVDLHKWLNAPYDAGLCIVRNRAELVQSMTARGAYLPEVGETWEPSESTFELSRRARGVPSYAILQHLGADGVRQMVTQHCALARYLADTLSGENGIHVLNDVVLNQVAIAMDTDDLTTRVLDAVQARGKVYPSHGSWQNRQIIRVSIINHGTDKADIDLLIAEIKNALRACQTD